MNSVKHDGLDFIPSKVVCIGRNYVEHIEELNNEIPAEPVVFIKPNSAISNEIESHQSDEIHYEGEISFIIKNNKISGIGFGLDLTKRKLQNVLKSKGLPWERAKAFDKSAVFSNFANCDGDYKSYKMELFIDNLLIQFANYPLMINKPEMLITDIQSFLTLEDGDIIMTGTPKGVGIINSGQLFTAKIYKNEEIIIEQSWLVQ
ncbi:MULTISPECIES: fumarylacetoacetate hydrolase family protein [unclassified Colwellia]|uniref:fumarylacetoacetate hydrolase family protein n=1 Tax=unclassified Colwellia TaxID=196834 RepID=UPI0015F4181D|nr:MULTISPECIES: fumarylacetoacetate hydrolase family protein [unclassified Colwellia]MBA6353140.1 fumarylacetoacetate hydrolase family protein [Colwellia sp. BRX9-1]MBA6354939.1 fumarylacetoacetate hydrolase family protein [Colwellia sp. BRX8-3]MBA6360272.1 fumarylacetoacetate hydrolase family protein [Colwellia sp. BRX8-6]MBA6367704.1 fumarylacetoacetate hydrolase family protein [Colwellia sp. BRX8-5]MBA6374158.1 fumarylacetoacetate hydrolase family protein [Colwellia sp. BRX8-2]